MKLYNGIGIKKFDNGLTLIVTESGENEFRMCLYYGEVRLYCDLYELTQKDLDSNEEIISNWKVKNFTTEKCIITAINNSRIFINDNETRCEIPMGGLNYDEVIQYIKDNNSKSCKELYNYLYKKFLDINEYDW